MVIVISAYRIITALITSRSRFDAFLFMGSVIAFSVMGINSRTALAMQGRWNATERARSCWAHDVECQKPILLLIGLPFPVRRPAGGKQDWAFSPSPPARPGRRTPFHLPSGPVRETGRF